MKATIASLTKAVSAKGGSVENKGACGEAGSRILELWAPDGKFWNDETQSFIVQWFPYIRGDRELALKCAAHRIEVAFVGDGTPEARNLAGLN
jgi:hypothetical protein